MSRKCSETGRHGRYRLSDLRMVTSNTSLTDNDGNARRLSEAFDKLSAVCEFDPRPTIVTRVTP